jgi:DNA polymerase-3 subunit gamma/tau
VAFYQKYRSKTFGELVGQEHVAKTLLESIRGDKLVHTYLLTGPRGIGKTSTARLLAKAINCQKINESKKNKEEFSGEPCNECESCLEIAAGKSLDVIEIDAASHTGVDDVRDLIEKARLSPTKSFKKVYIIDEVHMLSKSAFNALLKTLEEPPSHAVFILATTEIHKIPATIISRTQRFDFSRATKEDIITNLKNVALLEKINIDDASLDLIAVAAAGGHRDALGLLEQVSSSDSDIDIETTRKVLGIAPDHEVLLFATAIFNKNPEEGLKIAQRLFDSGHDLLEFNRKVIETLRKVMLCSVNAEATYEDTSENIAKIRELAKKVTLGQVMKTISLFIESGSLLKDVQYPMLPLEIAVVKATAPISNSEPLISNSSSQTKQSRTDEIKISPPQIIKDKVIQSESVEPVVVPEPSPKSAMVPVPVLEMTKDIWHQVIESTKKENSTLAALLRDANPEQITDDTVTLGVKFKFHKDKISEKINCDILENIISEVTGSKYKVVCKISADKPILVKKEAEINQEKAVSEVFET